MGKKFNITGLCIPEKHYMVDIAAKLSRMKEMVEAGEYFTINRPRQYGKTTTLYLLADTLQQTGDYLVLRISFEGIDQPTYEKHERFIRAFLHLLKKRLLFLREEELAQFLTVRSENISTMGDLSDFITGMVDKSARKVVLMIDEVDKSTNNQLFMDFLGMLREKYLLRLAGEDVTFQCVILAGVHDVKSLKLKLRPDEEQKYNSPWNIAVDPDVEMSFNPVEIGTMLLDYQQERGINLNREEISRSIYYYTSGYPFLVSMLCKIVDERMMKPGEQGWAPDHITFAVKELLKEQNTNFDSLIKNLENNRELAELVSAVLIEGRELDYNLHNPTIYQGILYGIFKKEDGLLKIHNRIYEQLIFNYLSSKIQTEIKPGGYNFRGHFLQESHELNFELVLEKFQEFMKEQYSLKYRELLEENGKLLFLAFLRPIINGQGFDFKETQISEEKRLDVVVTYLNRRHVVEMKIWRGPKAHEKGMKQLADYLERLSLTRGYLLIFDFRSVGAKEWRKEKQILDGKEICMVWV